MAVPGMALSVECPACEARFEVYHGSEDHRCECPTCHFAFDADDHQCRNRRTDGSDEHETITGTVPPAIPGPRWLEAETTASPPPIVPPITKPPKILPPDVRSPPEPDESGSDLSEFNLTPPGLQEEEPGERLYDPTVDESADDYSPFPDEERPVASEFSSPIRVAVAILLGFISVASLIGIILLLARRDSGTENQAVADSLSTEASLAGDRSAGEEITPPATTETADVSVKAEAKNSVGEAEFVSTGNKVYDRIWRRNSKHIVKIEMGGPDDHESQLGFVIDRRGWVLTGIQKLSQYETKRYFTNHATAWNQPLETTVVGPPSGVTRAMVEYNLCVLQIPGTETIATLPPADAANIKNRPDAGANPDIAPALHAADAAPVEDDIIEMTVDPDFECVEDSMMYAITPVADGTGMTIMKCRVFDRRSHSDVPEETRQAMADSGIAIDGEFNWIVHDGMLNDKSAICPLFSKAGDLVAIHLFHDDRLKTGYAVGADIVPFLKTGGLGQRDLKESPVAMELAAGFSRGPQPAKVAAVVPIKGGATQSMRRGDFALIDRAREEFALCDKRIDWLAKSTEEYNQLQRFTDLLVTMDDVARDEAIDKDRRIVFELEADSMYEKIGAIDWPSPTQIEEQNKFAEKGLSILGQPVFAYVKVVEVAGIAREVGEETTVLFELIGTDQKIVIKVKEGHGHLKANSQWLLMGVDDQESRVKRKFMIEKDYALVKAYRLMNSPR